MLPEDRFVFGLSAFFLAHVAYIVAFLPGTAPISSVWPVLLLGIFVIAMTAVLWPHVGSLRWPVLAYEIVIVSMAWCAWERWAQTGQAGALLALVGGLLFVVSDSVLALDRFARPFARAGAVVLGTYYGAQWLIAMSVR
ncbi:MAG TPA: lysoplasmalogenase [Chloroflexi bacterium]|jgi:uncharacterized membrane protein YhhN|nr:lysoplasmalogenase [Chloroflexota bacterium]